jgi:cytoskeletal protein CcmA (bactofilin family)
MSDIRVKVGQQNTIKSRVGQQNTVKVVSSVSGAAGGFAFTAENVIGGIASVTSLNVSGLSTFIGVTTFKNNVYIDGDLYVNDDIFFDEFTARNINVTGIGSIITLNSVNSTLTNINSTGISTLGIVNASQFYVSGVSTFVGVATFKNNVYIDGDLYISDDLVFDEFTARNANITGILTVGQSIYYPIGQPYGVAYFDLNDRLVSTGTTASAISETNYILTTDNSGIPAWSGVIDGGTY